MAAVITAGQNQFGLWYRVNFQNGEYYIFGAEPFTPENARGVFQSLNEDYAMVFLYHPHRSLAPFIEGMRWDATFIQSQFGCDLRTASFMSSIMHILTLYRPADDILAAAQAWYDT